MGYVLEGVAYLAGILLIAGGIYLVMRGNFPAWWQRRLLWPIVRVTPRVAHLQGWAAIGLGASILAIVLSNAVSEWLAGLLVMVALAAYVIGLLFFLLSTWLSRRPAG